MSQEEQRHKQNDGAEPKEQEQVRSAAVNAQPLWGWPQVVRGDSSTKKLRAQPRPAPRRPASNTSPVSRGEIERAFGDLRDRFNEEVAGRGRSQ